MSTVENNQVLNQPKLRVLVLEDNSADALLLIKEVQQAGFEVEWQRVDGESTFHDALSPNIDLILADYSLPSYDGLSAVRELRRRGLDTPFILISGKMGEETAVDAIKQGADDYLLKDRLARLAPAVEKVLESRRLRQQQIQMAADNVQLIHQLTERVKELTALHQVSRLLQREWAELLELFREMVVLLPAAFQHPDTTAARIRFGDIEVLTNHFRRTSQHYAAHFCTDDETRGVVEAVVLTENSTEHPETFLIEEKYLIDTIAEMLQRFLSHRAGLQRLRENEKLLMDAQRIADLGSWEMDLVTGQLRWCQNTLRIFGLQPEQFSGQFIELVDRIHPQDRKKLAKCLEAADQRGGLFEVEYRILRMDGTERILREKGDVQLDGNGRPLRRIGLVMDITDRRAIEKSLQESEQRLSAALLAGRMGIFEWDIATSHIVWSPTHYEIFGYPTDNLFPVQLHHFKDRIHPDDRQKIEDALQTAMRDRIPYAQECRIIWPDGSVHWVKGAGAFEYTEVGVASRMLGIAQDITARKHAEHGLLESEERYRTIVQNSPDIILIQQGDSITFVNQAGISLLRAGTSENIVGRSPEELVHSDFIVWVRTTLELLKQKPVIIASTIIRMIALDGTLIDADVQASSILNEGQLQIQFVCRDITESKQAELELLRRTNDLERFNSAAVGRELRMIELKRQINELSDKCGIPRPYSLDFADG